MKTMLTTIALISTMMLASCVKSENKKVNVDLPQPKKHEPYVAKKSGYKCDIIGDDDNKEVFLKVDKKDDKITVAFHDFVTAQKISVTSSTFGSYKILSFTLSEDTEKAKTFKGTGILSHSDLSSLSDEGKVISIIGRLTLNEDMSGLLEQKLMISKDDSMANTEFAELAKIENCEAFEAVWL